MEEINQIENIEDKILKEFISNQNKPANIPKEESSKGNIFNFHYKLVDQVKTIDQFRKGVINVLISTSVAEEGFDIPECNLVVSFSPPFSLKSFIHLKGRARKENSSYIIICPQKEVRKSYIREKI